MDTPPCGLDYALPDHLDQIAALLMLIPARRERSCPRAVKSARHNKSHVKKPTNQPAPATGNRPPIMLHTSIPAEPDQLKLRGIEDHSGSALD